MRDIKGKYDYTERYIYGIPLWKYCFQQTVHSAEMKYQMIMARSLPEEVTQGTLEGDIIPGDITFYRLQSTSDKLRAYGTGRGSSVATRSFGGIGIFAIPEMGQILPSRTDRGKLSASRRSCIRTFGKAFFEVFKYIGVPVEEIGYNQPEGVRYPTENPWG